MLCMLKHILFSCVSLAYTRLTKFNAAFSLKVAENYIYSYENAQKLLPPKLLLLAQISGLPLGPLNPLKSFFKHMVHNVPIS